MWKRRAKGSTPLVDPGSSASQGADYTGEMDIRSGDVAMAQNGRIVNVRSVTEKHALCTWMDDSGTRHSDVFPIEHLRLIHALEGLPEQPANAAAAKSLREYMDRKKGD